MDDMVQNGKAVNRYSRGVGIALSFVLASQIFPFMLSSAFTARTIVHEKDEVASVETDLNWALILSIASSLVIGYFMGGDWVISLVGGIFGLVLYSIYIVRGELPWNAGELVHHLVPI
jgi:Ca2+/Na+ antiporter